VAPRAFNLFAEEVFRYGHVTFSAGIRYDRFASNADRPFSLDTVSSSPTFGTYLPFPRVSSYAGTFQGDSLVVTMRDQAHSAFQPRFRMQYAPSPRTAIRIGYSKQAEIPDFSALYAGINTDLAITNVAQAFGTDLDLARSWIGELGGRQRLGRLGSLDAAVWTRRGAAGILSRLVRHPDPTRHGAGLDIRQFAVDDSASASGAEIRLERTSGALTGSIGYAYLHAEVANGFRSPNDRPHTVTAAAALRVRNTAAFAGFRYASGVPFDTCQSVGNEGATSDVGCASGFPLIGFRTSRLPALRQLDLRLTQALRLGGRSVTAFLDARNALGSRNVLRVYSVTGTTSSPLEAQFTFSRDSSSFANEAKANSLYRPDGAVDLTFAGGATGGCAAWRTQTGSGGAPNCVALIRAEQRFGNGDGVFDLTEQRSASSAAYAAFHGAQLFTATPRRVRVGLQIGL